MRGNNVRFDMDPLRHAFFLLLFTSILAAEPAHARSTAGEVRGSAGTESLLQRAQRLAVTLRQTIQRTARLHADPTVRRDAIGVSLVGPQVRTAVVAFRRDAFCLPPPTC
jgi:hypothetical protein